MNDLPNRPVYSRSDAPRSETAVVQPEPAGGLVATESVRPRTGVDGPDAASLIEPDLLDAYDKAAAECQALARHFGDRQNSDSTLTAREASKVVTAVLNAGNLLADVVNRVRTASEPTPEKS